MSKIGKIFKKIVDPLGIVFKAKKKKVFIPVRVAAKQGSAAEVAQRREETAARLRSGRVTALAKDDDEEENKIRRAGARRAKLLGS